MEIEICIYWSGGMFMMCHEDERESKFQSNSIIHCHYKIFT